MTDYFDRCIAFVLRMEGGYTDNPNDNGNWTGGRRDAGELKGSNFGISAAAYPELDIKALTVVEATEIYRRDYWQAAGCDHDIEWPLCLVIFDTAVNMGLRRALEFDERALNWTDYLFIRIEHYVGLNQPAFLRGWVNRCLALWKEAKAPTDEHPVSM